MLPNILSVTNTSDMILAGSVEGIDSVGLELVRCGPSQDQGILLETIAPIR